MKKLIPLTLLSFSFCINFAHATESKKLKKLESEIINAEAPHLTTRIPWIKFPHVEYSSAELSGKDRSAVIKIHANKHGKITKTNIQESTGLNTLDKKLIYAIEQAQVHPPQKNGEKQALIGYQTFTLRLNDAVDQVQTQPSCQYTFQSEVFRAQRKGKSTPFLYLRQPVLKLDENLLKFKDRTVKFKFKINKYGQVTEVKLKKLSGVNAIDQAVITALSYSKVRSKPNASTLWLYKKNTLNDEINFVIGDCR